MFDDRTGLRSADPVSYAARLAEDGTVAEVIIAPPLFHAVEYVEFLGLGGRWVPASAETRPGMCFVGNAFRECWMRPHVPAVLRPGELAGYGLGDIVLHGGRVWVSRIEGNLAEPGTNSHWIAPCALGIPDLTAELVSLALRTDPARVAG